AQLGASKQMLDYHWPFANADGPMCRDGAPPVWLSAVGGGRLVPIQAWRPGRDASLVAGTDSVGFRTDAPPVANLVFYILGLLAIITLICVGRYGRFEHGDGPFTNRAYARLASVSIAFMLTPLWALMWITQLGEPNTTIVFRIFATILYGAA